eukprot:COSAG04_NODE_679_length_11197_cov_43.956584_2_plen_84_part_00
MNGPFAGDTHGGIWRTPQDAFVNKQHRIENNFIFDMGQRALSGSAVWMFQSGENKVLHNHMQEGQRSVRALLPSQLFARSQSC